MAESLPDPTRCSECKYRQPPAPLPVVRTRALASAGMIEALLNHEANRQSGKEFERERVQAREPFVRKPHHFEWCERYTPTEGACEAMTEALRRGDEGPAQKAQADCLELAVDYVAGRVIRLFALCVLKNTGRCKGFKRPDSGGSRE
jgi:hypothetical protein